MPDHPMTPIPVAAGLVKPLVWTESDCLGDPMFTAAGYVIDDEGEQYPDGRFHLTFGADVSYSAHVDTLDLAKAAAQADYEARIRAALSPETLARLALVERMEEALRDAEETLALVEHPAFPDPRYHAEVKALGNRIGFGALMSTASAGWREILGDLAGGEYVAGPCHGTIVSTLARARAILAELEAAK